MNLPKLTAEQKLLFNKYYYVVISIAAKKAEAYGRWYLDDFKQEGAIGLLKAITTYDPNIATLQTYAAVRIRGAILDYLRKINCRRRRATKNHLKIQQAIFDLDSYDIVKIAAKLRWTIDKVWQNISDATIRPPVYLGEMLREQDEKYEIADRNKACDDLFLRELINKATRGMNPTNRLVFTLIFVEGYSQSDAAKMIGLSASRISQLVKIILKGVRSKLQNYEI